MTNHEIFAYKTLLSAVFYFNVFGSIAWSIMAQTLKILTEAYTSRIVRGQSTLKDVIER